MKAVCTACEPRPEVLSGDLREGMFAAGLRAVMDKSADEVYKKPRMFFVTSLPGEGLQTLLRKVRQDEKKDSLPLMAIWRFHGDDLKWQRATHVWN